MRFIIQRNTLLKSLQMVIGAVERRHTMPILANVLLVVADKNLAMTCTDLEVELISNVELEYATEDAGSTTVSGHKLFDICKVLPENSMVEFTQKDNNKAIVRADRSRFVLTTLPANGFPSVSWETDTNMARFSLQQQKLRCLFDSIQFAMAQQDVRYYLNGLLLEFRDGMIWSVATDGHRLALNGVESSVIDSSLLRVIVPRKGIIELMRLLEDTATEVTVSVGKNHVRVDGHGFVFTSKLIDGEFPDYDKAIPRGVDKEVIIDRGIFKGALARVAVLSSDAFQGVRMHIGNGTMRMFTSIQGQEEAEEEIAVEYKGEDIATGFNINYLLDIMANTTAEKVVLKLKNKKSSALLEEFESESNKLYVVMPIHL